MLIDTISSCLNKSAYLQTKGVTAVGRYYRVIKPQWALTKMEAQELSAAQLKIFAVYEDTGQLDALLLTKKQGRADGKNALKQAMNIGQPLGGVIYFAVEGLPHGYKTAHLPAIRDYFAGVKASVGTHYQLGVYGDGIVCKTLLDEQICTYTWLAAASTSFEGTVQFYKGGLWNLAQTRIDQKWDKLSVDVNEAKGDFGGFFVPIAGV